MGTRAEQEKKRVTHTRSDECFNVSTIKKQLIHKAARVFGKWAWNRNKWDKESGFSRTIEDKTFSSAINIHRLGIVKRTLEQRNKKK